ncbi:MAG TPA: histidine phosphatase family protein [Elusimicrobiota bacterium]|nr:histidine phosphatase family protein [Elusimicrobiota bacterium]
MPSRVFIIRHGETEWSLSGRHTSRTDLPLTEAGERDARAVGAELRSVEFRLVLSSPALRARRTCELAGPTRASEIEPALVEWGYGEYEGRTTAEIVRERPDWDLFRDGCPGGETPAQVSGRVDRVLARARAQGGNVALFTHGHLAHVMAARWIGLPVLQARHFSVAAASVSILGLARGDSGAPVIALWNSRPGRPPA